jgi:hypothetical protein
MADVMRWRYGETNPIVIPVDAATVIEIGDLVYLDGDDAKPAASQPDAESAENNQAAFHAKFAGVAMQRSRSGDVEPIRVATTGVFEFVSASATYEVGLLIGPAGNAGEDGLENQKVVGVESADLAIGRCARRVVPADVKVLVDILSTVMYGGPQPVYVA